MSITTIAVLFTVLIIAFFAWLDHMTDKRNAEAVAKRKAKFNEYYEQKLAQLDAVPAYKRKLSSEQLAKLEAELEGYKPTVQEYWLPTFKL